MRTQLIAIALAAAFPLGAYAQGMTKPDQQQRPGASSPAPATKGSGITEPGAARLDTNRDGLISREEAKASSDLNGRFNELDKNRDGSLSAEELSSRSGTSGSSPMKR
jgi:hypothetical protein